MDLRIFTDQDLGIAKEIHEKFYQDEFSFQEFLQGLQSAFVISDNSQVVTIAGIRPIAEIVMLTNLDTSIRQKQDALTRALGRLLIDTGRLGYTGAHAFTQDKLWEAVIRRHGFRDTTGKCLVIG